MVERSTFCADSGGFRGLWRTVHSDLPGEIDRLDGFGNLAKVRVASSNLVVRFNKHSMRGPFEASHRVCGQCVRPWN